MISYGDGINRHRPEISSFSLVAPADVRVGYSEGETVVTPL
jgi:hypothetical protein